MELSVTGSQQLGRQQQTAHDVAFVDGQVGPLEHQKLESRDGIHGHLKGLIANVAANSETITCIRAAVYACACGGAQ